MHTLDFGWLDKHAKFWNCARALENMVFIFFNCLRCKTKKARDIAYPIRILFKRAMLRSPESTQTTLYRCMFSFSPKLSSAFFHSYKVGMEIIRTICRHSFLNPFSCLPGLPWEKFLCWRDYFREFNCVPQHKIRPVWNTSEQLANCHPFSSSYALAPREKWSIVTVVIAGIFFPLPFPADS